MPLQESDSEYAPGFSEDCDGDTVLSLERAADLLTPDIPFEKMMESLAHIPLPVQFDEELCVQSNHPGVARPNIHFTESELSLFKSSMELWLTRDKLQAFIETIRNNMFNVKDISSDPLAKLDRAHIQNILYQVLRKL